MKKTLTAAVVALGTTAAMSGAALAQDMGYPRDANLSGIVTSVGTDSFMLAEHYGPVEVHVDRLSDNPLDGNGRIQIQTNDRVTAAGLLSLDKGVAGKRILRAGTVSLLVDASSQQSDR